MSFRFANYEQQNVDGQTAFDAGAAARADFEQRKQAELQQLEAELAKCEQEIAEFDAQNPGFSDGDMALAANRAEVGDFGYFNGLQSAAAARSQQGASAAKTAEDAVWNALDEAGKLAYGLDSATNETADAQKANIRVMLDKAARTAKDAGIALPSKYYELERMMNGQSGESSDNLVKIENELRTKVEKKMLKDSDIEALIKEAQNEPNSDRAAKLRELAQKYKYRTVGSGIRTKASQNESKILAAKYADLSTSPEKRADFLQRWNSESDEEIVKIKKYHELDPKTGILKFNPRKGVK